jgi:Tol biopolymer transport system component
MPENSDTSPVVGGVPDLDERLESWKSIASYLKRDVSTVQRWEKIEALPVRRLTHSKQGTVYALKGELDAWRKARSTGAENDAPGNESPVSQVQPAVNGRSARRPWLILGSALLLVTVAVVAVWRGHANDAADIPIKTVPLTSYAGVEASPSFSPDGNQVAFSWDGGTPGQSDIYVKMIGTGGDPLRLTTGAALHTNPVWSPNGRWVSFLRSPRGATTTEVFIVPPIGGPQRNLGPAEKAGFPSGSGTSWTPDSKSLAVVDRANPSEPYSLFLVSIQDGSRRKLTTPLPNSLGDSGPAFSPDGRTLAFTRGGRYGSGNIYLLALSADFQSLGDPRSIHLETTPIGNLMWTPDGREILYLSGPGPSRTLWRTPVAGNKPPQQVPSVGRIGTEFAISRSGNRLAYSDVVADVDTWRLDLGDVKAPPVRLISSTGNNGAAEFSPDGTRIVFSSNRSGYGELCVSDRDGTHITPLTSLGAGTPRWSPDGSEIAFDATVDGNPDIYVISAAGGTPRHVTDESSMDLMPSWSRDGKWIYFRSNRTGTFQVWKTHARAEPGHSALAVQVTREGGLGGFESFDSKFFYYAKGHPSSIWRVPAGGGTEREFIASVANPHAFAVARDGIYVLAPKDSRGGHNVEFRPFASAKAEVVGRIDKEPGSGFSVSPPGAGGHRSILFAAAEPRRADLHLVENFR